jgi:23S rRNA pseudouridine1911/1915/1917 synthase
LIEDPKIIYEDDNISVINKPAGLAMHGDGFNHDRTLVDWILEKYPETREVGESMFTQKGEEIKKPAIIHRLDKETSGVIVLAKNQGTFLFIKKQFQDHEVKKIYRAILSGNVSLSIGEEKVLDWPIGRSKADPRLRVARAHGKGKLREASTTFRLLENICTNYAYVEAEPQSGRTHQLRAHFKSYSHPIIGDSLYNPKDNGDGAIGRTALHAYEITIKLIGGEERTFVAPLPPDFTQALEKLKASC